MTGSGKTYTKADLLDEARSEQIHYEHQEDTDQTVRIWGDTAVVTAKLWEKGTNQGKHFDKTVWFSDTYVCTPTGWRYVFGQSSLPLPDNSLSTEAKAGQVSRVTNMREKRCLFPFWITGKTEGNANRLDSRHYLRFADNPGVGPLMTTRAFIGTNATDEPITPGLPVIQEP